MPRSLDGWKTKQIPHMYLSNIGQICPVLDGWPATGAHILQHVHCVLCANCAYFAYIVRIAAQTAHKEHISSECVRILLTYYWSYVSHPAHILRICPNSKQIRRTSCTYMHYVVYKCATMRYSIHVCRESVKLNAMKRIVEQPFSNLLAISTCSP